MRVHVILRNSLILLSLAALALWQIGCDGTTPATGTGGSSPPKVTTGAPAGESTSADASKSGESKSSNEASSSDESDDENMEVDSNDQKGVEKSEPGDEEQAGSTTGSGRDVPEAAPEEDGQ